MKDDFELIQEYKDISKTNKPKIAPYHGDMFIDVEMEYLMRKELEQRIDKAIDYIRDCCKMDSKIINLHYDYAQKEMSMDEVDGLLEILKGEQE